MTKEREGEVLMMIISVLESLFPIVAIFSISFIGSLYSFAFVVATATIVLVATLSYEKKLATLFHKEAQKDLLFTSFYITSLFLLVFLSLRYTTAGNVAVIMFLQLLFSYLYFNLFGSEKMQLIHTIGAGVMGVGALTLLWPESLVFNIGDLLALAAAAIAPIANVYQRRARKFVASVTILTYRNLVALPLLFLLALIFDAPLTSNAMLQALPYILFNGTLVYVLAKILWIEALHRISITKMSAMLAFSPIFTLIFANIFLDEALSTKDIFGVATVLIGSFYLTKK